MTSRKKYLRIAAARACAQALKAKQEWSSMPVIDTEHNPPHSQATLTTPPIVVSSDSESETAYQGGVNYYGTTSEDETDSQEDTGYETVSEFSEEDVTAMAKRKTPYEEIQVSRTKKEWKKAEAVRSLGYNGQSERNIRYQAQKAREREALREQAKIS
ncbi:hypothetical protein C0992_012265, partial [Termitomyces sp. T32_za158]